MSIIKNTTTKAIFSLTMATTLFLTTNVSGSVAQASVGPISYEIPTPTYKNFDDIKDKYKNDLSDKTVILTTNDVHGAIEGYPYVAGMKKYFGDLGADVILVDSGDFSQDKEDPKYITPENGLAIDCMNSAGYDIAALGNHEGMTIKNLQKNLEKNPAKFDIVDANILKKDSSDTVFLPNCIRTTGNENSQTKIGFFGLDTKEAKSSGIKVLTGKEMQKCAQEQYNALKNDKADIVICLAHLGLEDKFKDAGERSVDIYNAVNGIDLIIDGHSHSIITPTEGKEAVLSTGTEFQNIGVVIIDNKEKQIIDTFLIKNEDFTEFDPISPKENTAAAATTEVVEKIKKESNNDSKKHH